MVKCLCDNFNTGDGRKKATFHHNMFYYFKKGKNTTETDKRISAVYGLGALTDWVYKKWFVKFHVRDF